MILFRLVKLVSLLRTFRMARLWRYIIKLEEVINFVENAWLEIHYTL